MKENEIENGAIFNKRKNKIVEDSRDNIVNYINQL